MALFLSVSVLSCERSFLLLAHTDTMSKDVYLFEKLVATMMQSGGT